MFIYINIELFYGWGKACKNNCHTVTVSRWLSTFSGGVLFCVLFLRNNLEVL